jgi:Ran GTPase-activating protein (RanGAP) involved in mRNA processing and transport
MDIYLHNIYRHGNIPKYDPEPRKCYISLANMNLGSDPTMHKLSNKLSEIPTATTIWLSGNYIKDNSIIKIVELLEKYTNITTIYLYDNKIGNKGAKLIANLLKTNNHLTILDLSYNIIGDKGVKLLGDAIKQNTSLITINLQNNKLTLAGIKYFLDSFKENTTIKNLYIGWEYRSTYNYDDAIKIIIDFIQTNKTVNNIFIGDIPIDINSMNMINSVLEDNPSITQFNYIIDNSNRLNNICNRNKHNLRLKEMKLVDL